MIERILKGRWKIIEYPMRKGFNARRRGVLINLGSGNRYIFNVIDGRVNYMREHRAPANIPKYVTREILENQETK
jgi:hypothetical protein